MQQYPHGYVQNGYAGYAGYGDAPQTQAFHPPQYPAQQRQQYPTAHVVIPQVPRQNSHSSDFHLSPHLQHMHPPATGYQQQPVQNYRPAPHQQYYSSHPQQVFTQSPSLQPQQARQYPNHQFHHPESYQTAASYPPYVQNTSRFPPRQDYVAASQPVQRFQHAPPLDQSLRPAHHSGQSHMLSSPDPLHASPAQLHHRLPMTQPQQRGQGPPPHHRSAQQSQTSRRAQEKPPQQRVVARVEIPVPHPIAALPDMHRPQKRRKSDDGHAVSVPLKPNSQPRPSHAAASSSPLTELASSQLPPTPKPHTDYQAILLALADEYITAAYSISVPAASFDAAEASRERYLSLISSAMACLESVLINFRQSDHRREARTRLRLAALMIEETDNGEDAEQVLSQGIALCERSRLPDLKYAMHVYLVRLISRTSSRAALKSVDKLIQEVDALNLPHWAYAFRFLRISLTLQSPSHVDQHGLLKHLAAISTAAEDSRHISVSIMASIFEAVVQLRSGAVDATELAQRALTAVRTHQLSPEMQRLPQIGALLDCLDLGCCLTSYKLGQIESKLEQMHANLDKLTHQAGWRKDGTLSIDLGPYSNDDLAKDTCGIMAMSKGGQAALSFRWLGKDQLYALGYLLSALAVMSKNPESQKAQTYLQEGLKLCNAPQESLPRSRNAAMEETKQKFCWTITFRTWTVFALCGRYNWTAAQAQIQAVRQEVAQHGTTLDYGTARTLLYLEAVCAHGLGDFQLALSLYQSSGILLTDDNKVESEGKDVRLLATLNSVLILRTLGVEEFVKADSLMAALDPHCQHHPSPAIRSAYNIVRATANGGKNAITKTKQYLQIALDAARTSSNQQLLSIVMNIMTSTLFSNIVGDQAEKSVRAAVSLARQSRQPLWMSVASGMYGEIMERCGKGDEALAARKEVQNLAKTLPEPLKGGLSGE
ncbi:cohesin loading factor-domain-containing protein [Neohortaea acidophila]|uniref:Cohesin loading factor-domain-containing protein n=1 Tax=Neohortaea acidophila TaxID=245834 RepID=A0A6A6PG26_9PEZI|nr:cohesin loading factor-domain-containing protein [Neohortaea acidophila]KAF2478930.1 cohesin loading factor-domain-containing protein [Neohortaea acidophila]